MDELEALRERLDEHESVAAYAQGQVNRQAVELGEARLALHAAGHREEPLARAVNALRAERDMLWRSVANARKELDVWNHARSDDESTRAVIRADQILSNAMDRSAVPTDQARRP
jgi:hypothetical protein